MRFESNVSVCSKPRTCQSWPLKKEEVEIVPEARGLGCQLTGPFDSVQLLM